MGCCPKKKPEKTEKLIEPSPPKELSEKKEKKEKKEEIEIAYPKLTYKDFDPLKLLGTGSFGRV